MFPVQRFLYFQMSLAINDNWCLNYGKMKKNSNFPQIFFTILNKNTSKAKQKHEQFPKSELQLLLSHFGAKLRQVESLAIFIFVTGHKANVGIHQQWSLHNLCFYDCLHVKTFFPLRSREEPIIDTCLVGERNEHFAHEESRKEMHSEKFLSINWMELEVNTWKPQSTVGNRFEHNSQSCNQCTVADCTG